MTSEGTAIITAYVYIVPFCVPELSTTLSDLIAFSTPSFPLQGGTPCRQRLGSISLVCLNGVVIHSKVVVYLPPDDLNNYRNYRFEGEKMILLQALLNSKPFIKLFKKFGIRNQFHMESF